MLAPRSSHKFFSYVTGGYTRILSQYASSTRLIRTRLAYILGLADRYCIISFPFRHACTRNNRIDYANLRTKALAFSLTSLGGHIFRHTCEYYNRWSPSKIRGLRIDFAHPWLLCPTSSFNSLWTTPASIRSLR